jgi:hypothetical protein
VYLKISKRLKTLKMRTTILTLFTALILGTGIAKTTYTAPAKSENVTVLNEIKSINKIEVHGNVQLYISDGATDEVKVYNKYYAESALVQGKNGVLSIASYKAEKLVVWVTAADLRSVSAYDNAAVESFGDLSKIEFELDLHNTATAKLNIDAYAATVTVHDQAKACLCGHAKEFALKANRPENIDQADFKADHTSKIKTTIAAVSKDINDEFAELR